MTQPSQISYSSSASQIPKTMVPIIPTAMRTSPTRDDLEHARTTSLGTLSPPTGDDDHGEDHEGRDPRERREDVQREQPVVQLHGAAA